MGRGTRGHRADAELVDAAGGGDKDAFGELVRRHELVCRRLVVRMLDDPAAAEEVVQEATLLAYLNLARLRHPARFGPWLCGIALNLARRSLREQQRAVPSTSVDDLRSAARTEERYEAAELASAVQHAVSRLPPGQRAATLLFYWQGRTHAEVAIELGISVDAVKNRLHHARAALAEPLAEIVPLREVTAMSVEPEPVWIEMSVAEIRRGEDADPALRPHVILLRERGGDRTLPVWVGRAEAAALAMTVETVEMPRPTTYQLTASLLQAAGARVREVRITQLVAQTFYASLVVEGPDGVTEVDARPSDAVNLAVLIGVPVMVENRLLDDVRATCPTEWREYRTDGPQLVAELRRQHEQLAARLDPR